tara:strand:+ start:312 stop:806 length:495 start_codon:yes stop_codon:yes gene_type:complete
MIQLLAILGMLFTTSGSLLVTGSDGRVTDLRSLLKSQAAVVIVMKSGNCPVCIKQLITLSQRRPDLSRLGAVVIGLNLDGPKQNASLERRLGVKVFGDADGRTLKKLGLWIRTSQSPMPGAVLLNRCGEIEAVFPGRSPGDGRTETILKALRSVAAKPVCGTVI